MSVTLARVTEYVTLFFMSETTTLYHGGPAAVTAVHAGGTFGGIFCASSRSAAASHGAVVTEIVEG